MRDEKEPWWKRREGKDPEYPLPKQFLDDYPLHEKKEILKRLSKMRKR